MTEYPTKSQKEKSKLTKEEWREYTKTVWQIANTSDADHPAVFPIEIPRRLIKLFSFHGDTVLDPFAGLGTTGFASAALGRRSICVEQNPRYVSEMCNRRNGETAMEILHSDSRALTTIETNSVGLIVTSPPYWNKADYGRGKANLGNEPVYNKFFQNVRPVFEECFRVLMPGRKLCLITANVNQHTEHGLLTFPLSTDFTCLLRDIGFLLVNEIVWTKDRTGGKWGSHGKQRPIFGSYPYPPNFLFKNVHEYVLIFAKHPSKKTNGKTVMSYNYLLDGSGKPRPRKKKSIK